MRHLLVVLLLTSAGFANTRAGSVSALLPNVKIERAGGRFEVRTPTAVAGVIGTDFGVDASDPDVTKFICISGNVQITSVDPSVTGAITCRGGTTVTVRRGRPPESPERATRDQMETWKTITEPDASETKDPYKTY